MAITTLKPMKELDVSVIIPVFNASKLINRCLDSIFNQLGNYRIEVIIIDDGSTDNSIELIKKRPEQDRIRLFRQENSGPSSARNKGIESSNGKYLAFLDADDFWLPEFIDKTLSFLNKNNDCIAVSVAQKHITTAGSHELPVEWNCLAPKEGIAISDFYSFWAKYNHICTGSIMIRTDIAKKSGGMREDLRICEDLEFWALLASYGKIGYLPFLLFVSDGSNVTEDIGWIQKHLPRWNAATSIETWQKRLLKCNKNLENNHGFLAARGRIAQNLVYSILLSKRFELAKSQIKKYGNSFPDNSMSKVLKLSVRNPLFWYILSRALVYREYHRK